MTTPPQPETRTSWRQDALCAQTDPEAFFPEKGEQGGEAKKICEKCPVRLECLDHALRADERFGIWGGLTSSERKRIRTGRSSEMPTRYQNWKRDRDAAIVEMAGYQVNAATIAGELGITDRTVHRVLAGHRSAG